MFTRPAPVTVTARYSAPGLTMTVPPLDAPVALNEIGVAGGVTVASRIRGVGPSPGGPAPQYVTRLIRYWLLPGNVIPYVAACTRRRCGSVGSPRRSARRRFGLNHLRGIAHVQDDRERIPARQRANNCNSITLDRPWVAVCQPAPNPAARFLRVRGVGSATCPRGSRGSGLSTTVNLPPARRPPAAVVRGALSVEAATA